MLTLPSRAIGRTVVFADTAGPGRVYACARPRLARGPDGAPRLSLVHWQLPDDAGAKAGGRLWLELSLALDDADRSAIVAELGDVLIEPVPWLGAELTIAGPELPEVTTALGLADPARAAASIDLSAEGAAAMAGALRSLGARALQASWTGRAHARIEGVEIRASADVEAIRSQQLLLGLQPPAIVVRTVIEAHARISISGPDLGEAMAPLRRWAIDRLCEAWAAGKPLSVELVLGRVVELPWTLAGTLDDALDATESAKVISIVDLDVDSFLRAVEIEVRVLAPFRDEVASVEVELALAAGPTKTLVFADETPQKWKEHVGSADHGWRWRARAVRAGRSDPWSPWSEGSPAGGLLVPIARTAPLTVEVAAAGLDFTRAWRSVRVTLEHRAGNDVTTGELVLDLRNDALRWAPPRVAAGGEVIARLVYTGEGGAELMRGPISVESGLLVVGDPLADEAIAVALVPTGNGWPEVAGAMVDLRYTDGDYRVDETLALAAAGELITWRVAVREGGPRVLQWRAHLGFRDGRFESRPWTEAEPGPLVVRADAVDLRELRVLAVAFDPAVHAEARVTAKVGATKVELVVSSREGARAMLPRGPYAWSCVWTRKDGSRVEVPGDERDADVLVLLPLPA